MMSQAAFSCYEEGMRNSCEIRIIFLLEVISAPVTVWKAKIREELEKAHEIAREKLKRTAIRQKDYYDRNVKEINYANGDLVRRWQPQVVKGGKKKLYRNWTGPWVIIEKLTDVLFKIKHSKNSPNVVVHADNLKKYKGVKSVSWFKPEKTILHAQPPLINYFDSEHELRNNGASENTHDTEPTHIQSDEYQTDETLEPPENCVYKTLESRTVTQI
ncbi:unnamed protein product [Mytilus edulis]|uniref:Integrase p58-like C-terminal domain-containing protein n=1 Tax=Mytilus edulis TaxID=6550 RepID=A0A8S3R980_MYTED|nr:unnamed protein product [Mytilus edulis]